MKTTTIYFQTRQLARNTLKVLKFANKQAKLQDNGSQTEQGKRWAVIVEIAEQKQVINNPESLLKTLSVVRQGQRNNKGKPLHIGKRSTAHSAVQWLRERNTHLVSVYTKRSISVYA